MIPIDLVIAFGIGIWYLVFSIVIFKHIRKQTKLLEYIAKKLK